MKTRVLYHLKKRNSLKETLESQKLLTLHPHKNGMPEDEQAENILK